MGAALNLIFGCAFKMILVECCLLHEQALCHGLHNERSGVAELFSTCLKPKTGVPVIVPPGRQNLNSLQSSFGDSLACLLPKTNKTQACGAPESTLLRRESFE